MLHDALKAHAYGLFIAKSGHLDKAAARAAFDADAERFRDDLRAMTAVEGTPEVTASVERTRLAAAAYLKTA